MSPDYIVTSGDEGLPTADRLIMVANFILEFAARKPVWSRGCDRQVEIDAHAANAFLGTLRYVAEGRTSTVRLSMVECLMKAWRRGGMQEFHRVMAIHRGPR